MIQKIRNLIFDLFRVRILGSDHDLCCFLSHLFQNLVNPLIKQVVGIRSFLRMLLSVCDRCIYRFKNLKRIFRIVLISYNLPIKASMISGMAGRSDLLYLGQQRIVVTVG